MVHWKVLLGAVLGAAAGYGGARLAPRWLEKPPRTWEPYVAAGFNGLLAGILAAGHPLDNYFWQQLIFVTILTTVSLVDLHDRIIPNEAVIFGLVAGGIMLFALPYPEKSWLEALGGAAAGFAGLLALALLVKGGMGEGDVKLAAVIGLFLGIRWVGMGLVLAFLAGGFLAGLLLLLRLVKRKDHIPFGPWLALGAAVTALYGSEIWTWYTSF